ncbi:ATP synthase subunit I [Actinospongicola halichondriae]|uniref:ATP synthase subunit I n=1 Tax=Actinospongicola halichondriae TaxID=3236844 RepID=UPI003D44AA6F
MTATTTSTIDIVTAPGDAGPAPEAEIVADLLRRALPVTPLPIVVGALVAGLDGAMSAGVGVALVLVNFVVAAASLAWAARINLGVLMGVSLFGYLLRISAMFGAVLLLRNLDWVHVAVLGCTIVVMHLGLLAWELKYVSASLAHPGLKPKNDKEPAR